MEEGKKCAKCGNDLCDECTCENDDTVCKDCCEPKDTEEDCAGCEHSGCCGGGK